MSIKLIINPAAGRGKSKRVSKSIIALLQERRVSFEYVYTNRPREAVDYARDAVGRFEKIIGMGGDGTSNEVGEGVVGSDALFGMIPMGSGNDFANENGFPANPKAAVDFILGDGVKKIDVIKVNDRVSLNTAGVGFNGSVSEAVKKIKYLRGLPVYIWGVVKTALNYKSIPMKMTVGETVIEDDIFMISICNSKREGGGFIVAPEALNDDGLFNVTIIRNVSYPKLLMNIGNALTGNLEKLDEVDTLVGDKISIVSEHPMPLHVDGEVVSLAAKEVTATIMKSSLNIISA